MTDHSQPSSASPTFAELDPATATALVRVLRDEGLRAWIAEDDPLRRRVLVVPADHERANAVLSRRMEDVQLHAARIREASGEDVHDDVGDDGRSAQTPLVMERFASMGWLLAVVLVPLLVVTLAQTVQSLRVVVVVVSLGVAAVVAGRLWSRRR